MAEPVIKLDLEFDLSTVKKQGQAIGSILERAMNKNTRTKVLNGLEQQIEDTKKKLLQIEETITDIISNPTNNLDYMPEEFRDAYNEAKKLEDTVKNVVNEARKIKPDISIREVREGLESTNSGKNFQNRQLIEDFKKYEKAQATLEKFNAEYEKLGTFQGNEKFERMGRSVDALREKLQGLIEAYRKASLESGNSIQNSLQPLINVNQEISQTIGSVQQAFGPYVQAATMYLQIQVKIIELEISALKKLGQVAIGAFSPLVSLAKMAASAIGKMFNNIKKHNETTLKNLWSNLLKYGIGVRSFYFLARKIRAVIGDIINELAKQIPEVNTQMSAFQTALNGLKGSLATAFQPILSAVLPALTALINAVSKAITIVGKFIALLTGQNFVYEATATQVDYAASLDKTGKSASKAKKALEGYLSPIDEINKYQSKKDDSSGSGSDGAGFTLKKAPIEDWIKDFWDKIKNAWDHADFFDLGKALGDKIAKALANIPWAEIRAKARQLGRSLATLLNGLMHGEFNGKSLATYIGQTIAGAINTAFDFVDSWVSAFEWDTLGKSIMEVIKGALDNLDWNLITGTLSRVGLGIGKTLREIFNDNETWAAAGEALARAINSLIYMVYGIFSEVEGAQVGAAISRFLNKFIEWIDSGAFVETCNEIMRDILDTLIVAIETTSWDELGIKLAQIINGIDFKGIFSRYSSLASSIVDAILDLVENFLSTLTPDKIEEIGTSIANAINGIDFQPERLGKVANDLLQALLDIAVTTVNTIDWDKLATDLAVALEQIDWEGALEKKDEITNKIMSAFLKLIGAAFAGIITSPIKEAEEAGESTVVGFIKGFDRIPLKGHIIGSFVSIVKNICELLGIHSPSTVFADIGTNVVEGFINGIKPIIAKVSEIWNNLKTLTINVYNSIKQSILDVITNIKTGIFNALESIKSTWSSVWESVKTTTISIFEGIWNGIKGIINSILSGIEAMVNGIIGGINWAVDALNSIQINPPEWIQSKFGIGPIGFHLPTLSEVSLPRLAKGAVIPPNREFMAVLGDQKNGTNIETPLSTMVEAFNTALRNSNVGGVKQINFLLPDRRTLAQYTIAGGKIIQTSTGKNPFELA